MIILLAGQKGIGKTTVAMNLARRLAEAGIQVGGILSPGIFEHNRKIGIKSHHPASGLEEIAGMETSLVGKPVPRPTGPDTFSYGRWDFNQSALAAADEAIIKDIEASLFVFVDEIGPLELDHGTGMSQTLARLDADKDNDNCAIVVCARHDLAQPLTERWPGSILVELAGSDHTAISKAEEAILEAVSAELATTCGRTCGKMKSRKFLETIRGLASMRSAPGNAQA